MTVGTYGNADRVGAAGYYQPGRSIALGVENLATWAHELVHAADDRRGELQNGAKIDREIVAELGGAVLLRCLGHQHDADLGGCWQYVERHAKANNRSALTVCEALLRRTCEAVAVILDTADELEAQRQYCDKCGAPLALVDGCVPTCTRCETETGIAA